MNNESQEEVLAFLGDPATHGDQKVHRIDTHAAAVFLAGDRALKIKRAVRFPFLDYSTLGKRREACEAELAVNAPYAPEIYRGVKAITREADGRLAIGGSGTADRMGGRDAPFRRAAHARSPRRRNRRHARRGPRACGRRRACEGACGRGKGLDRRGRFLYRRTYRGVRGAHGYLPGGGDRRARASEPHRL